MVAINGHQILADSMAQIWCAEDPASAMHNAKVTRTLADVAGQNMPTGAEGLERKKEKKRKKKQWQEKTGKQEKPENKKKQENKNEKKTIKKRKKEQNIKNTNKS